MVLLQYIHATFLCWTTLIGHGSCHRNACDTLVYVGLICSLLWVQKSLIQSTKQIAFTLLSWPIHLMKGYTYALEGFHNGSLWLKAINLFTKFYWHEQMITIMEICLLNTTLICLSHISITTQSVYDCFVWILQVNFYLYELKHSLLMLYRKCSTQFVTMYCVTSQT